MPSSGSTSEDHHHHHAQYTYIPKMENKVPPSISKLEQCVPKQEQPTSSTPRMERSMSSSYFLERGRRPQSSRSLTTNCDDSHAPPPPPKDELLVPVSNVANLSFVKNQRNALRTELKAQQVAGAEAKASVAALRRLAFRMAVNISVKEKKIAASTRNLIHSRKQEYMTSRDAEKRIEKLTKSWKEEERRNREILESLERAAMLTLQYATSDPLRRTRPSPNPVSPPASPPTRVSSLTYQHPSAPKTPPHSPASSISWESEGSYYNPNRGSLVEIRTSNDRLIKAKRESDHALLVCRSRIEALQADCLRSKEGARVLEVTRTGLEEEIRGYQSRVSALENSKNAIEDTLRTTQSKLDDSLNSETVLKAELELKTQEISQWEEQSKQGEENIRALGKSKALLEEEVRNCSLQIQRLEAYTTGLEEEVHNLQIRLDSTEHREADLQQRLAENESLRAGMENQMEKSQANVGTLEKAVEFFQSQIEEYQDKITAFRGEVSWMTHGLKNSEELKSRVEGELETAQLSISEMESNLRSATELNASLRMDLGWTRIAKTDLETELQATKDKLTNEADLRAELQSEIDSLQLLKGNLERDLQAAHAKIHTLEQPDLEVEKELQNLRDSGSSLEEKIKAVQEVSADLQQQLQAAHARISTLEESDLESEEDLNDLKSSKSALEEEIQAVQQSSSDLQQQLEAAYGRITVLEQPNPEAEKELNDLKASKVSLEDQLSTAHRSSYNLQQQLHASKAKLASMEASLAEFQDKLRLSEEARLELTDEVHHIKTSKAEVEEHLQGVLVSNADLEHGLQYTKSRLLHAQTEGLNLQARLSVADNQLDELRRTNTVLEKSEKRVSARLAVAENELSAVRQANEELEAFLEQAEQDMLGCEAAVEDSEKRLDNFMGETSAKLDAAQRSKMKYKRRLSAKFKEVETLKDETSSLHRRLESQDKDIESLKSNESKMMEQLKVKDATIEELQRSKSDFAASIDAVEEELRILRESKKTFEQVVETLQEKTRHLEVLAEWDQPAYPDEAAGWTSARSEQDSTEHSTSSPIVDRNLLSRNGTVRSQLSVPGEGHRPASRASVSTRDEDLDAWAKEVERVRMLRDETVIQLKGMSKVKSALKKTLKASEAQLEVLQKKAKPKKRHSLLQKRKPSTFTLSPFNLSRPSTGNPLSPSAKGKDPIGSYDPESRTWSNAHSEGTRPNTPARPSTPFGRLMGMGVKRPSTRGSSDKEKVGTWDAERKRWSDSVRTVFRRGKRGEV